MSEIRIITAFGHKIAVPFEINDPDAIASDENNIINSDSTISDNQEETEVTEESC